MSKFEVIRGVEGCCLALDDTRIAGPKPWGGGTVIHTWETDDKYKSVDTRSRWFELFGTPERSARTITRMQMATDLMGCCDADTCPAAFDGCWKLDSCPMDDYDALLEWLRGDA